MRRLAALGAAAALLAAIAVAAWPGAAPAAAHAVLLASSPGDGGRLDEAPAEVTFRFNEPVSATTGAVRVLDASGARVDDGDVDAGGTELTVGLRDGLGEGTYVAGFRVVSADGHPVRGAISFTVGDARAAGEDLLASVFDDGADRPWEVAGAALRWIAYLGALTAAGGALYLVAVEDDRGRRAALLRVAAAAGALAVGTHLLVQAHLASGFGIGSLFRRGVAADVLAEGVGASAAAVVAGLVAVAAGLVAEGAARRPLLAAGAVAAAGGFALSGHTRTSDPAWLATAADAVHLLAAATWVGGTALLAASLRRHRRDGDPAAAGRAVARWSALAAGALLAVAAAGAVLAWREVRSLDALGSTTYGRLLVAKLAVVAVVVAAAAYNRLRLVPAVAAATADRPRPRAWARLRRSLGAEAAGMVAVLAVTGVLVQVTPARAELTGPFSATVPLGEGAVNLVVDPARAGRATVHLYLLDAAGRVADLAPAGLAVELSLPDRDVGPLVRQPRAAGPGHYLLDGDVFALPGTWRVELVARASRFESATATVEVPIRR